MEKKYEKILVIGSGPIVIGQAAEFDYSGTQACKALREEGVEVVLVNSNPATIMTDWEMADRIYIEPITVESISRILEKERPDGIIATLGGQTGLNLAMEIASSGVLDKFDIPLLGASLESISMAEDRELFRKRMGEIGEPVLSSVVVRSIDEGREAGREMGFPLVIRPAYTLGGTGGGVVETEEEFERALLKGLKLSPVSQVLLEKSVVGWKEIEFEVMRDRKGNVITICGMENVDPMGIHTGDSIVVAPTQTLNDIEYQMLRSASLKIISALKIEGGCNIQFALNPNSREYYVIEVNPRVSRSSALASKATGFPIARLTAKIALGRTLDEIRNPVTKETYAAFEPALDYVVVKIPKWAFEKFKVKERRLGTQMQATGEVMALGRTFEEALSKALRSLEVEAGLFDHRFSYFTDEEIKKYLKEADDRRLFLLAEGFRRGLSVDEAYELTKIDKFFLTKIYNLIKLSKEYNGKSLSEITPQELRRLKKIGLGDYDLSCFLNATKEEIFRFRRLHKIFPVYKIVDTCAAEFSAQSPYYYSTYEEENEAQKNPQRSVVVIGSGPIRIGQGIEFDYCTVHAVQAIREEGLVSVMINNNPETLSTDFDMSDRLYFEPLTAEDVTNIMEQEEPLGFISQFGGQTAINLLKNLTQRGFYLLGTSQKSIDLAEDREKFDRFLRGLNIPRPEGYYIRNLEEAREVINEIGFPVLLRPSYVLGGRAMIIVTNMEDLESYFKRRDIILPLWIDQFILGKETEVDLLCDGKEVFIPGVMEHIERAGVHSGDSTTVFPAYSLSKKVIDTIVDYSTKIALGLEVKGLLNIQYVVSKKDEKVYVLEANPRASRTVPYLSKILRLPLVRFATKIALGYSLKDLNLKPGLHPSPDYYAIKAPVFSFTKIKGAEIELGPEMRSTGEVMGIDYDWSKAIYKALLASGIKVPINGGRIFVTTYFEALWDTLIKKGYKLYSLEERDGFIKIEPKGDELTTLTSYNFDLVVAIGEKDKLWRRACFDVGIPCIVAEDMWNAIIKMLSEINGDIDYRAIQEFYKEEKWLSGKVVGQSL
ncbi:MAG TPA: carbamoyl-phosphate synthase (glutamine-hydrolyzing) large subunit [Dictyoglomaceae bacterium]|nr:carbamoyl-phosphate synthase (glutamine-hydrolyzing) large subunit [Dictyoglomaceae bacterium]